MTLLAPYQRPNGHATPLQPIVEPTKPSAALENSERQKERLTFVTARQIAANSLTKTVEWALRGMLAIGSCTELTAKVKLGKTEFVLAAIAAILDGLEFIGFTTLRSAVVYLTEQPSASFLEALRRRGLTDRDDLIVLSWRETIGSDWPIIVEAAVAKAREVGARVLVVDTLPQFAGIADENDAGQALAAMQPLQVAAADGLAVLVVRHDRKSGGDVGDSGRGSSAFAGAVDILLTLRRGDGHQRPTIRHLHALSRFDETPDTLVIELTNDGYVALGDEAAVSLATARELILESVPATESEAVGIDDLLDRMDGAVRRTTAQNALKALIAEGSVRQVGAGRRGDPRRYFAPVDSELTNGVQVDLRRPEMVSAEASFLERQKEMEWPDKWPL